MNDLQALGHRFEDGKLDAAGYLGELAYFIARTMNCSRVGLWTFVDTDRGPALHCVTMVDAVQNRLDPPTDMVGEDHLLYFETLLNEGCLVADDAQHHPATIGFLDEYLKPKDVHSLLDVCHSVNGELFGVVSCEQVGRRVTWSARQLQLVRQIVSRAGLTLRQASLELGVAYRRPGRGKPWNDTDWHG